MYAGSREQLLTTRSITTIGQQTHHVQVSEGNQVQVGTMTLQVQDKVLIPYRQTRPWVQQPGLGNVRALGRLPCRQTRP